MRKTLVWTIMYGMSRIAAQRIAYINYPTPLAEKAFHPKLYLLRFCSKFHPAKIAMRNV